MDDDRARPTPWRTATLAALVVAALENERALDISYRATAISGIDSMGWLPNYKPMAQVALKRRFKAAYPLFVVAAVIAIAALQPLRLFEAAWSALTRKTPAGPLTWILPTVSSNRALIRRAMTAMEPKGGQAGAPIDMTAPTLAAALGLVGVARCMGVVSIVYATILARRAGCRLDLLLHARDLVSLALLCSYVAGRPEERVWTDDHYQRWAFLLSRTSDRLAIAQHGFLTDTIAFPHRFGTIEVLAVRAERYVAMFAAYYRIGRWGVFAIEPPSDHTGLGRPVAFLASSAPHIAAEIAFLRRFRALSSMPVIVKLHPAHVYDGRKAALMGLADHCSTPSERPVADVFVSHSSFMALDYENAGALVCSLADHDNGAQAAEVLAHTLDTAVS